MATFEPTAKYPDLSHQQTVSSVDDKYIKEITEIFGPIPENYQAAFSDEHRRYDNQTLAKAFSDGKNATVTNLLILHIEQLNDTWHTDFANVTKVFGLEQKFNTQLGTNVSLDRAPEGVAPRFVSLYTESRTERMVRWNLGARENGDFYKTPDGLESMRLKQYIILSAAVITSKIIVEQAIVYEKMYYKEMQRVKGPSYLNVKDALLHEVSNFGGFNKDNAFIYKINNYIEETIKISGLSLVNLNRFVVSQGTLSLISIGNKFEITPQLRGYGIAEERLTISSASMVDVIPGKLIFENKSWTLENIGTDEMNSFRRLANIGQYFMIDGSNHGNGEENYNSFNTLSVKHRDLTIDGWALWTIKSAIDQSMRWNTEGNLSQAHYDLVNNLPNILQKSGIHIKDDLVDPYIWKAPSFEASSRNVKTGFNVIEHWGDMDTHYWSTEQTILHAKQAVKQLNSEFLFGPQDYAKLEDYKNLVNELYNVSSYLTGVADYNVLLSFIAAACLGSLKNVSQNNRGSLKILPANRFGSLDLPTITTLSDGTLVFTYTNAQGISFTPIITDGNISSLLRIAGNLTINSGVNSIPPRLMPFKPFGFVGINHFRTLAAAASTGRGSGYDEEILKRAANVVIIVDKYATVLMKLYPKCEFWNPMWVPDFAHSNKVDYDTTSSFVLNIFDRVRYPFWVNLTKEGGQIENLGGDANNTTGILNAFIGATAEDLTIPEKFDNILSKVAQQLGNNVINFMSTNGSIEKFNNTFTTSDFFGKPLGTLTNTSKKPVTFSEFLKTYVIPDWEQNENGTVALLVTIITSVFNFIQGHEPNTELTVAYIKQLKATKTFPPQSSKTIDNYPPQSMKPQKKQQKKRTYEQQEDEFDNESTTSTGWLNSRLLIDPDTFKELYLTYGNGEIFIAPENPYTGTPLKQTKRNADQVLDYARSRETSLYQKSSGAFHFTDLYNSSLQSFSKSKRSKTGETQLTQQDLFDRENALTTFPSAFEKSDKRYVQESVIRNLTGPFFVGGESGFEKKYFLTLRLEHIIATQNDNVRVPALLAIFTRVTKESLLVWIDKNLPIPDSVYVFVQPWVRIYTEGMLAYSSGGGVAKLMYGHEDVINQYDGTTKTWFIHYTIWLGCAIFNPTKLMFIPDVRLCGYAGGMDSSVYTDVETFDPRNFNFQKSGFVFSMGSTFSRERALRTCNPMSLFGKHNSTVLGAAKFDNYAENVFSDQQQWPSFLYYNNIWNFTAMNQGETYDISSFNAMRVSHYITGLMFMTYHLAWDSVTKNWTHKILGTGHLPNSEPPLIDKFSGNVRIENNFYKN